MRPEARDVRAGGQRLMVCLDHGETVRTRGALVVEPAELVTVTE